MLYLSKLKEIGTSSRFFNKAVSLFLPPKSKGPKLTLPSVRNTLGSMTLPQTMNCYSNLNSGMINV